MVGYLTFTGPLILSLLVCRYGLSFNFSADLIQFVVSYLSCFSFGYFLIWKKIKHTPLKKWMIIITNRKILTVCCVYLLVKIIFFDFFHDINLILRSFQRSEEPTGTLEASIDRLFYAFAFFIYPLKTGRRIPTNVIPMIILFVMEFLAASRAVIMISLLFMIAVNILQKNSRLPYVDIIKYAGFMLIFFLFIGYLRGSFDDTALFEVLGIYLFGGLMAFDYVLVNQVQVSSYVNLIPIVSKVYSVVDPEIISNSYAYPLVSASVPTNIYTAFREVYNDFGTYLGMYLFAFGHGLTTKLVTAQKFNGNLYTSDVVPYALVLTFNLYFVFYPIFLFSFLFILVMASPIIRFKAKPQKNMEYNFDA